MEHTLDYWDREQKKVEQQINSNVKKNNEIQNNVDRLEKAYKQLKSLKENEIKQLKNDAKLKNCIGTVAWRGEYKVYFDGEMDFLVREDIPNHFIPRIDEMLKQLNQIKTAMQKKKKSVSDIINDLNKELKKIKSEANKLL